MAYLRELLKDQLFMRVCMFIWGLPFIALGAYCVVAWRPVEAIEWFGFSLVSAIGVLGFYLVGTAVLGSAERVEKSTDFMHEGGEIVGLVLAVFVAVIAVPITICIRAIGKRRGV